MNEAKTLLFVDDDPFVLNAYRRMLRAEGYQLEFAETFNEARELLQQHSFQLMLVDQMMPDGIGLDFIREVKQEFPQLICLLLSGGLDITQANEWCQQGWIDDYLEKPCAKNQLEEKLSVWLSRVL